MRPILAKRQIVADYINARLTESVRQRNQQWRVAIRTSAMREDQGFQISHLNENGPPGKAARVIILNRVVG
jgi:hypothetical protein